MLKHSLHHVTPWLSTLPWLTNIQLLSLTHKTFSDLTSDWLTLSLISWPSSRNHLLLADPRHWTLAALGPALPGMFCPPLHLAEIAFNYQQVALRLTLCWHPHFPAHSWAYGSVSSNPEGSCSPPNQAPPASGRYNTVSPVPCTMRIVGAQNTQRWSDHLLKGIISYLIPLSSFHCT